MLINFILGGVMKKSIFFIIFGIIITSFSISADEKLIFSVTADAIIRVSPDRVALHIGAETRGENLSAVKRINFDIVKNTIEILKKNGIEDRYIGTDYVNIETWYEDRDYKRIRFTVRQSLSIIIVDISKYDQILADVINVGINQIHSIEFQTTDLKKYRYEARALAIAAAKEKADFLAREAGFKLTNVINLAESTNDYYWRPRGDRNDFSQNISQTYIGSAGEDSETLAPGMISITSRITLYYNVE
jgi:uncharacterized protein YggE